MSQILHTHISQVSVYQRGARITRTGKIELPIGENQVKVEHLTKDLDKDSVRVRGIGNARIINVAIEEHSSEKTEHPEMNKLRTSLKTLERKIDQIKEEIAGIESIQGKYDNFATTFYNRAPVYFNKNELPIDRLTTMDAHLEKKTEEMRTARREKQQQLEEWNIQHEKLQRELNALGRIQQVEQYYDILINLDVKQKSTLTIELQFQVPTAYWVPIYDVNLEEKATNLTLFANVFNTSHEEWKDIELEISSANLSPVRMIEPTPFVVQTYVPPPKPRPSPMVALSLKRGMRIGGGIPEAAPMEAEPMMEYAAAAAPAPPPMQQSVATVENNLGAQSYQIPGKITVPADMNPHPISLLSTTLKSTQNYFWSVATPDMVIINDTLENGDLLLLPGKVKVYFEGEFIGESSFPLIAPQEKLELGMRRSYDVKVEKKMKARQAAKEGLLKGKISKGYSYDLEIKVFNPTDAELKLMDRIVYSDSEKIKITSGQFSHEPISKDMGIVIWKIPLKDVKDLTLHYEYEVIYEKDVIISPPLP